MSHFISVPTNENGIFFDPLLSDTIEDAVADNPFAFQDVFVYSHGWATDADQSMSSYSRFSIELARQIVLMDRAVPPALPDPPRNALGIGIHWPSEITEDPSSPLNVAELFTFYTMEHRADAVGKNAVYTILRKTLEARAGSTLPLRLFLLGHSFGCKVLCSALQDLQVDLANGTIVPPANVSFRVVLLEPATDNDNLESGDIYGNVADIEKLRILMTRSDLDEALTTWFLEAGRVVNLFAPKPALGAAGPTQTTLAQFGTSTAFPVNTGFAPADAVAHKERFLVADLTPVHMARKAANLAPDGGIAGSHSDIYFLEVYNLIAGFLFS
ncbi:MAG: alpha/beta hydrolase [Candidatus Eremiobacteraeota bacterium]|nr:alpha/beta hydrolase [Candidatus Eremiobacteraeota bacterium]